MLPGNKMKTIEDVTACNYGSLKGAQKHAQLGQDAMEKILQAATQDICISDRCFVMFFEVNMLFGDMFDAYMEMRQQWNYPSYFVTAVGNESHADLWRHTKREHLKAKHLAKQLQMAGHAVPDRMTAKGAARSLCCIQTTVCVAHASAWIASFRTTGTQTARKMLLRCRCELSCRCRRVQVCKCARGVC